MATTYNLISKTTVGSGGTSTIDFQSIPSTYTDIVMHLSFRLDSNSVDTYLKFNNSSASEYNYTYLRFNYDVGVTSGRGTSTNIDNYTMFSNASSWIANGFGNASLYIPNYASSNKKPFSLYSVTAENGSGVWSQTHAGLWNNASAINRITFTNPSGGFAENTTAYLYGISNA